MNAVNRNEAVRHVSVQKMERLSNWANRKPVIAIMGEFSSGKSTLLNMLVGQSILPMRVTATRLPPVWFKYGDDPSFWVDREGQRHAVDLNDLGSVPLSDARFIRIYAMSEQLKECDLIDTPGISDPNIPTDKWISAIGYANCVLWCTHAGQAWRESERSQWESLPDRLRENSLLLVTRADKIVSEVDLGKINRRLLRETGDLFSMQHFISLTMALKSREGGKDADLWVRSGAEVFMNSFETVLAKVSKKRSTLLRRYQAEEVNSIVLQDTSVSEISTDTSIEKTEEAAMGKYESNVSVLRPVRIRSASGNQRKPRLSSVEAEKMRLDILSNVHPTENAGSTRIKSNDNGGSASIHSIFRTQDESLIE